jgi:hypothetical protein
VPPPTLGEREPGGQPPHDPTVFPEHNATLFDENLVPGRGPVEGMTMSTQERDPPKEPTRRERARPKTKGAAGQPKPDRGQQGATPAARSEGSPQPGSSDHVQQTLDDALADSFPASDPVSIVTSQHEEAWDHPRRAKE